MFLPRYYQLISTKSPVNSSAFSEPQALSIFSFSTFNFQFSINQPYKSHQQSAIIKQWIKRASNNFNGGSMPQGMSLGESSGRISYDAPCSDAGQTFVPGFNADNGPNLSIQFRVK